MITCNINAYVILKILIGYFVTIHAHVIFWIRSDSFLNNFEDIDCNFENAEFGLLVMRHEFDQYLKGNDPECNELGVVPRRA